MWKWTLEYLDHLWLHVQMKRCRQRRHRENSHSTSTCTFARRSRARNVSTRSARESTQDQSILVRNRQNSWMLCMRDSRSGEVTHSRMQIVSRYLGREPPNSISGGGETWIGNDPDTRPRDLSGSSLDPEPKRTKTTSATDNENLADQRGQLPKRTSDISSTGTSGR